MSEAYERYEERLLADATRLRDLQEREVAVKERAQELNQQDSDTWPERQRAANHHDIMARVAMMLLEGHAHDWTDDMVERAVRCARIAADAAYPPKQ